MPALVGVLRQGVAGRHLQLFGNDRRVQAVAEGFGADGTMRPREGYDFVAVVDANVSYVDAYVAVIARRSGQPVASFEADFRRLGVELADLSA